MLNWKFALSSADASPSTAPILLNGSIADNLKKAARLGYDAIEVHMREDADFDPVLTRDAMDQTGVKVAMVITGRLNTEGGCSLMDDRPYVVTAAMDSMRRYVDIASSIGAGLVVGWIKGNVPNGRSREPYMNRLAKALRVIQDYAAPMCVPINIEVINRYETNVFNTARETVEFIKKNGLNNCFAHLDTFHMNIEECDIVKAINETGRTLGYFHVADNNRHAVGTGEMDFLPIMAALKNVDYNGYISVECLPIPTGEEAAKVSLENLKRCAKALD